MVCSPSWIPRSVDGLRVAGARTDSYIGRYVAGGQLERYLDASDRSWRALWVRIRLTGWDGAPGPSIAAKLLT